MPNKDSTSFDVSDNLIRAHVEETANKLAAIESLAGRLAEMRVEAAADGGRPVSEYDLAAIQEAIRSLAQSGLQETERALEALPD